MSTNYNYNFGKFIDEVFKHAPDPLITPNDEHGGIWTNDAQKYFEHGYLPIEHAEMPQKEGFYYTLEHEHRENKIVEVWIEHENNEISGNEFLSMIEEVI